MSQDAVYCFDRATVRFAFYPAGEHGSRVLADITEDALRDLFGARGDGQSLVKAYFSSATWIDAVATLVYFAHPTEPILLDTPCFERIGNGVGPVGMPRLSGQALAQNEPLHALVA